LTAIRHQPMATFRPGAPLEGYYNDLSRFARRHHRGLPGATNPVTVAQVGLGAWQLAVSEPSRWLAVVGDAADWLMTHMDVDGRLPYSFAMGHTFRLDPPWFSAMAQGEAASLLVRAAPLLGVSEWLDGAARAVTSLTEPDSALVAETPEGPVLQEYPTDPPAHVLNGWIFALWGLYDVAWAGPDPAATRARQAFAEGSAALARRLPKYQLRGGWSRYDLRAEGPINVASPFYHHLHVQQLRAFGRLVDEPAISATAEVWQRARFHPLTLAGAVAGKLRFRRQHPRGRRG
jgi:heparosan-N-sulfate-glucuronate 5-epimerase